MASAASIERDALDELEPRWRQRGYTVIREPGNDQLPPFLRGYQPDAIAIGPKPSLVIEIIQARGRPSETKLKQIKGLLEGHDDWRLEAVYTSTEGMPVHAVDLNAIRAALYNSRELAGNEPRAGLLMAWATLEAIARILQPDLASRGLSPGSLVDLLVSHGHLPDSETKKLRSLGSQRNALAHGQIDVIPDPADVRYLVDLAKGLVA